jgi:hypothetical protein
VQGGDCSGDVGAQDGREVGADEETEVPAVSIMREDCGVLEMSRLG